MLAEVFDSGKVTHLHYKTQEPCVASQTQNNRLGHSTSNLRNHSFEVYNQEFASDYTTICDIEHNRQTVHDNITFPIMPYYKQCNQASKSLMRTCRPAAVTQAPLFTYFSVNFVFTWRIKKYVQ